MSSSSSAAGHIGQAIARRVSAGKHVAPADLCKSNAEEAAEALADAGFAASMLTVDVSSRESVHDSSRSATRLATSPA